MHSQTLNKTSLQWFAGFFGKYRKGLSSAILGAILLNALSLIPTFTLMVIIDRVMVSGNVSSLYVLVFGLVFLAVTTNILEYINYSLYTFVSSCVSSEMAGHFYRHMLRLPLTFFANQQAGDIVNRTSELENIKEFLAEWTVGNTVELLFSVVILAIMFTLSPLLTGLLLLTIPVHLIQYGLLGKRLRERFGNSFQASSNTKSLLIESISNIETIKSNCKEGEIITRMDGQYAHFVHAGYRMKLLQMASYRFASLTSGITEAVVMLFGVKLVLDGSLTLGTYMAFNLFSGRALLPIIKLPQVWERFVHLRFSIDRLADVLNVEPEATEAGRKHTVIGAVAFEQVSFGYAENRPILQNVNFQILPGEILCIVGESGSGKSTLTKLISRLMEPDGGKIIVDNHDVSTLQLKSLRSQIAYVIQDNALFSGTVRENIAFSDPSISQEDVEEAARQACAHEFIMNLEHGYDTHVAERGSNFSGGQRQRISLARAFASQSRILVLDEATSALDYETEYSIVSNIRKISSNRTVIIVSHRLSIAKQADVILVLKNGTVVEQGSHQELMAVPGHYQRLCELSNLVI